MLDIFLKEGSGVQGCRECPYVRIYDYGRRIYYCGHEGREDDMGKIGEGCLPAGCPVWCPLKIVGYTAVPYGRKFDVKNPMPFWEPAA